MGAAFRAVPIRFSLKISVHRSADRTGLAAGKPLAGFHDLCTVPAGHCSGPGGAGRTFRRRPGPWTAGQPDHAGDVQCLDAQGVVLPDQRPAHVVVGVVAQPLGPAVGTVNAALRLPPAPAARRPAGLGPLPAGQRLEGLGVAPWVGVAPLALGSLDRLIVGFGVGMRSAAVHCQGTDAHVHAAHRLGFSLGR